MRSERVRSDGARVFGRCPPGDLSSLLRSNSGFVLPVSSSLVEAIRPCIEDGLRANEKVWNRYLRHRARWVEEEARMLSRRGGSVETTSTREGPR